jgi:hypothetical protein
VLNIPAHVQAAEGLAPWEIIHATDGTKALICPEETKHVSNCQDCGYCFKGQLNDVVFLKH